MDISSYCVDGSFSTLNSSVGSKSPLPNDDSENLNLTKEDILDDIFAFIDISALIDTIA